MDFMRKIIFFFMGLILALGFPGANQERRLLPGRSAHPLFGTDGDLLVVYENPGNGLSLSAASKSGVGEIHDLGMAPPAKAPVIKRNKSGDLAIAWEQQEGTKSAICFGYIMGSAVRSVRTVAREEALLCSPDFNFDPDECPWAVWIQQEGQRFFVRVLNLQEDAAWTVNGLFDAYASNPKILVNASRQVWVFWTGRDQGRDEIFGCSYDRGSWTKPFKLDRDGRYPHMAQAACLDPNGLPWIVWSSYDGNDYEIFYVSWNGLAWSEEERITENADSDMSPSIAFVPGGIPLVLWSKSSGKSSGIWAKYRMGNAWSPEIPVVSSPEERLRTPRFDVLADKVGLTWETDNGIGSLIVRFSELVRRPEAESGLEKETPYFNPDRDENQYTGFGDSITYAENQGYIPRLEPMLAQKYGSAIIWNEGYGGETTPEGLARIDEAIASHASRYLFLMEGTNDVIFVEISMDTAAFNLENMSLKCLGSGVFPLIATIIPRTDWRWDDPYYRDRIYELNSRIRRLADTLKIPLVDQFGAFYYYSPSDGGWRSLILPDGVHPNPKGFDLMAATWFTGIKILPFPPVDLRIARATNRILFYTREGNLVRWQNSPKAEPGEVVAFKVYRKDRSVSSNPFQLLAVFPYLSRATDNRYFDASIDAKKTYAYVVSALRWDGVEGPCSEIVNDIF
jgi:lysophospholipase L1-like esterase